jgi:DNA recombination protein RmuC
VSTNQTIFILAVAVSFLALILIVLIIVIFRGRRGPVPGGTTELLEVLGRRLERFESLSNDVSSLSKLFLVPHTRGAIGETILSELLRSWLPAKSYELQYSFSNGSRVDAVIRLGEYIVPIDAKFPLESVRRSIEENSGGSIVTPEVRKAFRRHIDSISGKYIRPEDGTLQFALMYIPSERIYYHAFVEAEGDLLEESIRSGVVPVSPGGLFLYLQTVAYGLKGFSFSKNQRELVEITLNLKREIENIKRLFETGNSQLRNLIRNRDDAAGKIDDIERILRRLDFTIEPGK